MAPRNKRKKEVAPSSVAELEQEYDMSKFVSFAAQKKYVTMDSVANQVENRKWEELVKHPEATIVLVVR